MITRSNDKSWLEIWEEYQQKHMGRAEDPDTSGLPFYITNDPRMRANREREEKTEIINDDRKGENKIMQNTNQNTSQDRAPEGRFTVEVMQMRETVTKSGHPAVYFDTRIECTPYPEQDYTYHNRHAHYYQPVDNSIGLSVMKRILTQMNLDCLKDVDINSLDMKGVFAVLPTCLQELDGLAMVVTISYNRKGYIQLDDWDFD